MNCELSLQHATVVWLICDLIKGVYCYCSITMDEIDTWFVLLIKN